MISLYTIGWLLSRCLFQYYFGWRVWTPENVPATGPVLLVSNHASYIDPLLIGGGLSREIHYLARDSLFKFPLFGRILRSVNTVPISRDRPARAGLQASVRCLENGNGMLIFPEGTRSPDGAIHPARAGIGMIIIRSQAPIVPVRVFGTFEAFGRHHRLPRPRRVMVKYGEPRHFTDLRQEAKSASAARARQIYEEVATQVMSDIQALEPTAESPPQPQVPSSSTAPPDPSPLKSPSR